VAAFIIESYKQLSPDSGTTTVFLLQQISHRLASFSAASGTTTPTPPLNQPTAVHPLTRPRPPFALTSSGAST
jgi:hypothetical protein